MRRRFVTLDVFTDGASPAIRSRSCSTPTVSIPPPCRRSRASSTFRRPCSCFRRSDPAHRARLRSSRRAGNCRSPVIRRSAPRCCSACATAAAGREIVLEEAIGPVRCALESDRGDGGRAALRHSATAGRGRAGAGRCDHRRGARACAGRHRLRASARRAGRPGSLHLRALDRARRDRAVRGPIPPASTAHSAAGGAAFLCLPRVRRARARFSRPHVRAGHGVPEDPATGSAVAAFAGVLASPACRTATHPVTIEQGYEMGRPSLIRLVA